jgi:cobalt-zinc-cadmium efflux system membrane fusion protein
VFRQTTEQVSRALFCGLLLFLLCGCAAELPDDVEPAPSAPSLAPGLIEISPSALQLGSIEIGRVEMRRFPETVEVTGRLGVNENRTVHIGSISEGRVTQIMANVGDRVVRGQQLAFIVSQDVHEGRAEYVQAVADLERCQAELEFARSARDRATRLYELKAGSLAQKQRADADFQAAEVAVKMAQAEIGKVEEHLHHLGVSAEGATEEYTQKEARAEGTYEEEEWVPVVAAQGGTVLKRPVTLGTVVSPSDHLFLVSDLSSLWAHADVPEKHLGGIKRGQQVTVSVQAYPGARFPARIFRIADEMNPETRTVHVICLVDNMDQRLKSEMYANMQFVISEGHELPVVPTDAIQNLEGRTVVFVQEEESRFRAAEVRTGRRIDDLVEVLEGLHPGDAIVTKGSFLLKSELMKSQIEE